MNYRTLVFIVFAFCFAAPAEVVKILPLTDHWVVVVDSTVKAVVAEIDRLSGGAYAPAVAKWEATRKSDRPDWTAMRTVNDLRTKYLTQARTAVEVQPVFEGKPLQKSKHLVGIGATETPGGPDPEYVWYWYLEYDQIPDVYRSTEPSRAIKVNQAGYLADGPKFAYLGAHLYGVGPLQIKANSFTVVRDSDGSTAHVGTIRLRDANSLTKSGRQATGENVYELDFTPLSEPGKYAIRVPGVGHSWPFTIGPDAYGSAFYTAFRGLYHQRCGTQIKGGWPRGYCHTAPVGESEHVAWPASFVDRPRTYDRFDVIGATTDMSNVRPNMAGGWHDAADWDRNNAHYTVIFDLLYAYELRSKAFSDGQLNIPESANGVPDILDEAAWGLRIWMQSMTPPGGVSGMVETWTHPTIDADVDYVFSRRTRWDSLLFAGAAAQLAEHLKPFAPKTAAKWLNYATRAYSFGANPDNSLGTVTINARRNRGTGEPYTVTWTETDAHIAPFLIHARARLYRATGQAAYLNGLQGTTALRPYTHPWTWRDYSPWLVYGALPYLDAKAKAGLIAPADSLLTMAPGNPYGATWPVEQDWWMGWGESDMTNRARCLLIAHAITGNRRYRDAAIRNVDFMFGANPMGMSWTTGIGSVYPAVIQHEISATDGIADPVPGITLYGPTGGMYRNLMALAPEQETPVWRTWSPHPTLNIGQCEFTIHETMSSTIFAAAMLTPEGWKPSAELKARKPKTNPERYYLP